MEKGLKNFDDLVSVSVGYSLNVSSFDAGIEASKMALKNLSSSSVSFAFVYISSRFNRDSVFEAVSSIIPSNNIVVSYCYSSFFSFRSVVDGVSVFLVSSKMLDVVIYRHKCDKRYTPYSLGVKLGQQILENKGYTHSKINVLKIDNQFIYVNPYTLFFSIDSNTGHPSELVRGVYSELGPAFNYVGSVVKQGFLEKVVSSSFYDSITLALMISKLPTSFSLTHGFTPLDGSFILTKTVGSTIYEINGICAVDYYCNYFDITLSDLLKNKDFLLKTPIGKPDLSNRYVLSAILDVGESGELICSNDFLQDSVCRFMTFSKDSLIDAVRRATYSALNKLGGCKPVYAHIFSCLGRKLILEDDSLEASVVREILGKDVVIIGMYAYSEIGKDSHHFSANLHSYSFNIFLVGK